MESFQNLFCFLLVLLCFSVDPTNARELPVCTSHDALCQISYYTWPIQSNEYSTPTGDYYLSICSCPGNLSCFHSDKSLWIEFTYPVIPERRCNKTEIAVTLLDGEPVPNEIVGDVKCQCLWRLSVVKTMPGPDGHTYVRQFTCGKPTCDVCKSDPPVCERVTPEKNGLRQITELPCQCPYGYRCDRDPSLLPVLQGEVQFYCEPTGNTTDLL